MIALALSACAPRLRQQGPEDTRFVISGDGVSIAYQVAGDHDPTIVFVHGWSCDRTYWHEQVPHFATRYRVVTVDLAGHGKSGLNRDTWSIEAFADDVATVVRALDLKDVVLVGHSMGGPVVAAAAQQLPGRVLAVVGVDTFFDEWARVTPQGWAERVHRLRSDFRGTTERFVRGMFLPGTDTALVNRITRDMASAPEEVGIGSMQALGTWLMENFPRIMSELRVPVGIIQSEVSGNSLTVADSVLHSRGSLRIEVLPETGHFLMLERPEALNRTLEAMIADWMHARPR